MRYRAVRIGEPERYQTVLKRTALSVEQACQRWIEMPRRGIRLEEQVRMERMLEKYIAPVAKGRNVAVVNDEFRTAILDEMRKLYAPMESRELVIMMLRGMADDALRKGWIRYNPFVEHVPVRMGQGKKYPALDDAEVQKVMQLDPRRPEYACLQVQLLTGMRPAEVRGLCWRDVQEQEESLIIRHQLRDGQSVPVTGTKNYRQRKIRPVQMTFDILREVRENQPGRGELVFADVQGNGMNSGKLIQVLREAVGRDNVRLHDLRVTHATMLYRETGDLHQVSKRLGHSGMEVTRRHYVHAEPDLEQVRMMQDRRYGYLNSWGKERQS